MVGDAATTISRSSGGTGPESRYEPHPQVPLILKFRPQIRYAALWISERQWQTLPEVEVLALLNASGPNLCENAGGLLPMLDDFEWTDEPEERPNLLRQHNRHLIRLCERRNGSSAAAQTLGIDVTTTTRIARDENTYIHPVKHQKKPRP